MGHRKFARIHSWRYVLTVGPAAVAKAPWLPPRSSARRSASPRGRLIQNLSLDVILTFTVRGKSLVLYGPTRTGKTIWARSLGNHAYFGGLFSMEEDISDAEYAVFDDFGGLKFLPSYKFWLGHQKQFYVTDKYKGKKLVEWGKPSIWINNEDPRQEFGIRADEVEWLEANCTFVRLDSLIVRASSTPPAG